jgi:imidazolonepropionase-like amidohydrolase
MKKLILLCLFVSIRISAQEIKKAPELKEGEGPFTQLIIRGVTLIDGTGAPPIGPVDIVVKQNRIERIVSIGMAPTPGMSSNNQFLGARNRPVLEEGGKELNCQGMYLMPGFIDMHGHIGGRQAPNAEYVFKLWMAHGITTIREPGSSNGVEWVLDEKNKSAQNLITAPRIKALVTFGATLPTKAAEPSKTTDSKKKTPEPPARGRQPITTVEQARSWVNDNKAAGADGIKFFGAPPDIMDAALRENKKLGLRSATHHAQLSVARWNVVQSAEAGLTSMEHWYGLPEAMLSGSTVQDYPATYNYSNEQNRFEEAGRLWKQAAPPYSEKWNEVMNKLLKADFTLDPTFNIYEASRDLHRARRAEWHETYTLPSLWAFYQPSFVSHGSYWHSWGTEQEVAWKENYRLWMTFVNEYKNRGGRVTTGSDSGFIFQLYGFAYIRELELLREAGFHPLEVIRSATLYGAQALGMEKEIGSVEVGKLADFAIVEENPLENLQVLYGTGAIRLTPDNKVVRVGGVKYTIKDGIIYDSKKLLNDVKKIVDEEKAKSGFVLKQPGMD